MRAVNQLPAIMKIGVNRTLRSLTPITAGKTHLNLPNKSQAGPGGACGGGPLKPRVLYSKKKLSDPPRQLGAGNGVGGAARGCATELIVIQKV